MNTQSTTWVPGEWDVLRQGVFTAERALRALHIREVAEQWEEVMLELQSDDPAVQLAAIAQVDEWGPAVREPRLVEQLLEVIRSEPDFAEVRVVALKVLPRVLREAEVSLVVAAVMAALTDRDTEVRRSAAEAAHWLDLHDATSCGLVAALVERVESDPDAEVRMQAVTAVLQVREQQEVRRALERAAATDTSPRVRTEAGAILNLFGGGEERGQATLEVGQTGPEAPRLPRRAGDGLPTLVLEWLHRQLNSILAPDFRLEWIGQGAPRLASASFSSPKGLATVVSDGTKEVDGIVLEWVLVQEPEQEGLTLLVEASGEGSGPAWLQVWTVADEGARVITSICVLAQRESRLGRAEARLSLPLTVTGDPGLAWVVPEEMTREDLFPLLECREAAVQADPAERRTWDALLNRIPAQLQGLRQQWEAARNPEGVAPGLGTLSAGESA